jgi:hypothetical protein
VVVLYEWSPINNHDYSLTVQILGFCFDENPSLSFFTILRFSKVIEVGFFTSFWDAFLEMRPEISDIVVQTLLKSPIWIS